jgi:hypothetical protein
MQAANDTQECRNTQEAQELLTVDDLATRLRVPRSWVYSHAEDLGTYKLGKYLRFSWPRVIERLEHVTGDPIVGAAAQRPSSRVIE